MNNHPLGKIVLTPATQRNDEAMARLIRRMIQGPIVTSDAVEISGLQFSGAKKMLAVLRSCKIIESNNRVPATYKLCISSEKAEAIARELDNFASMELKVSRVSVEEQVSPAIEITPFRPWYITALYGDGPAKSYWPEAA